MTMGLLNMIAHKWVANPASHRPPHSGSPAEMKEQLWQEIGRLSFGHRSHLSDDPTYLSLLKERGREICQYGSVEADPLIQDLVAKVRSLDQQIQSHHAEQLLVTH
jgi:hypothetical protein